MHKISLTNCLTQTRNTNTDMKLKFFRANWCGPCRQMAPVIGELQDSLKDYYSSVEYIDIDNDPETAAKWRVNAIPTFVIVDDRGNEVARHIGAWPKSKMQEWMVDNYQSPSRTVSTTVDHSTIHTKEKSTMIKTIKRMLGLTQDSPIIGSIELWGGMHIPQNFLPCQGQRMNIKGNEALYSIIGTLYGGDGRDYFLLPDYRPRDNNGQPQPYDASKAPVVLICVRGLYPQWDW